MAGNKRWTSEEDHILLKEISKNMDCLERAFKITSIETGRTIGACRYRWYGYLNCTNIPEQYGICFAVLSEKKAMLNRKTLPVNYAKDYKLMVNKKRRLRELMKRIKALFS